MEIEISTTRFDNEIVRHKSTNNRKHTIFTGYFHKVNLLMEKKAIELFNILETIPIENNTSNKSSILNPLKEEDFKYRVQDKEYGTISYFTVTKNIDNLDIKMPFTQLLKNFKSEEPEIFHYIGEFFPISLILDRSIDLDIKNSLFKSLDIYFLNTWKKLNYYIKICPDKNNHIETEYSDNFEKYSKRIGIEKYIIIRREEEFIEKFKEITEEKLEMIDMQIDLNNS